MNRILFSTIGLTIFFLLTSCVHQAFIGRIPSHYNGDAIGEIIESPVLILFYEQYFEIDSSDYHDQLSINRNEIELFTETLNKYYEGKIIYKPIVFVENRLDTRRLILDEIKIHKEELLNNGVSSIIIIDQNSIRKNILLGYRQYDHEIFFVNVKNPDLFGHAIIRAEGNYHFGQLTVTGTYKYIFKQHWIHNM